MDIPFIILILITTLTMGLSVIGVWKKIPFLMTIVGVLFTFVFMIGETIDGEPLDMWFRIIFMLFGCLISISGALVWKSIKDD